LPEGPTPRFEPGGERLHASPIDEYRLSIQCCDDVQFPILDEFSFTAHEPEQHLDARLLKPDHYLVHQLLIERPSGHQRFSGDK
jgi:hypothetical protein